MQLMNDAPVVSMLDLQVWTKGIDKYFSLLDQRITRVSSYVKSWPCPTELETLECKSRLAKYVLKLECPDIDPLKLSASIFYSPNLSDRVPKLREKLISLKVLMREHFQKVDRDFKKVVVGLFKSVQDISQQLEDLDLNRLGPEVRQMNRDLECLFASLKDKPFVIEDLRGGVLDCRLDYFAEKSSILQVMQTALLSSDFQVEMSRFRKNLLKLACFLSDLEFEDVELFSCELYTEVLGLVERLLPQDVDKVRYEK